MCQLLLFCFNKELTSAFKNPAFFKAAKPSIETLLGVAEISPAKVAPVPQGVQSQSLLPIIQLFSVQFFKGILFPGGRW